MKYKLVDGICVVASGKWPNKVKDAIFESVRKWKFIARWHERNFVKHALMAGTDSCALCQLFVEKTGECDGCPVMRITGLADCAGTPYATYAFGDNYHYAHAMSEATFLKGLLK